VSKQILHNLIVSNLPNLKYYADVEELDYYNKKSLTCCSLRSFWIKEALMNKENEKIISKILLKDLDKKHY